MLKKTITLRKGLEKLELEAYGYGAVCADFWAAPSFGARFEKKAHAVIPVERLDELALFLLQTKAAAELRSCIEDRIRGAIYDPAEPEAKK